MLEQVRDFPVEYAELMVELDGATAPGAEGPGPAPAQPEARRFELPAALWLAMLACYATFFTAIAVATGGSGQALFAIAVSVLYTAMYFGTAGVLAAVAGPEARSPLSRGRPLPTWTGPMKAAAVWAQVLIVPFCVAVFGISIAIICAVIL